jgi:ClpP class serine protease
MTGLAEIAAAIPWALSKEWLSTILNIADRSPSEPLALESTTYVDMRGPVAVVSITGPVFRYANIFSEISGATSIEILARDLQVAIGDPAVSAIVLSIDSPGGQAQGINEICKHIRAGAAQKPIVAYVGGTAASAAYWLASAASRVVIDDAAALGSIGVVMSVSRPRPDQPLEFVSSNAPNKRPDPTSESGRAHLQEIVDAMAAVFVDSVADYRNTTPALVESDFGRGGILIGAKAIAAGLADSIGTLEGVIASLAGEPAAQSRQQRNGGMSTIAAGHNESIDDRGPRAEWNASPTLRSEFGGVFSSYLAYRRAEAKGLVKHLVPVAAATLTPLADGDAAALSEWSNSPALRAEFGDNRGHYLAWHKANRAGDARVFGAGKVIG